MKKFKNTIWGLCLVAAGIIWGLDSLKIIDFNLFFDGWWTLFIIVPCLMELFTGGEKTGSILGLIIGVLLFLSSRDIMSFKTVGKLFIPILLIIIGAKIIFGNLSQKKKEFLISKTANNGKTKEFFAIFSGQEHNFGGEVFSGAKFIAIFGGIECDLRGADIQDNSYIEIVSIFGGVDLILPENVNVKLKADSVFGGVDNHKAAFVSEGAPTVYIKASCVFGGAEIK